MTSSLAASFRALFPLLTALAALAILGGAGLLWYAGYGLPLALGLVILGGIVLVACFGLVAIQIENNDLLAVIAEALSTRAPPPGRAARTARSSPADAAARRGAAGCRPATSAAPRGRVEPALSARRG
jgi:hypothetical protein